MKPAIKFPLVPVFLLIGFNALAATRFVRPVGFGAMDGTSWANAFPGASLQTAINASGVGDEVWVAAGTYKTTAGAVRTIYFSLKTGVAVYGSFAATETLLSQRSIACGPSSILSAEIGAAGIADNSYHVISNTAVGSTAILDGFTVSDGNANFDMTGNDHRSLGGGMLNAGNSGGLASPTVRNCLFTNNSALFGGGMFNHGQNSGNANPAVSNCIFFLNTATSGGGGMDNFGYNGTASPTITNCVFAQNTATSRAGGMYCWGGGGGNASPVILNCSFVKNTAVDGGGLVADRTDFGGGSNSGTSSPVVRNSFFWGNTVTGTGPQFFLLGGALFFATYSDIDLTGQNAPHTISGPGTGNLNADPLFINDTDFDGADNCWMTADDGLHVGGGSPGIDAGDNAGVPAGDLKFYVRIANGTVDMGIYEESSAPLPMELSAFYGIAKNGANQLFWATASERNSHQFEIGRSTDAAHFEKIGTVLAAGNSPAVNQYRFTDDQPTGLGHFYRLKLVDLDGRHSFGPVVFLKNENPSTGLTFPNPVSGVLEARCENGVFELAPFYLLDAGGQVVRRELADGAGFSMDLGGIPGGVYFLKTPNSPKVYKVVKVD